MNEAETRAELIDPMLTRKGWGQNESKVSRELKITEGKITATGGRTKPLIADYVLTYKGRKLAAMEAKSDEIPVSEGVAQAVNYAQKLKLEYAYSCNGNEIYEINMATGIENPITSFPTPDELWNKIFTDHNVWKDKFNSIPNEGVYGKRFYQEIAINRVLDAIAERKPRILLTLATGTGKTVIAFQIVWKLFQTRWNLNRDGGRRPRILFLTDRNILADQAYNTFSSFPDGAMMRIRPGGIRRTGHVPVNANIFFTIFQTFMSGEDEMPYFGEYSRDFFDFIIIDECHRGGANDESNWRAILDYFSPAVQLGLTATPRRTDNADTYSYFGNPVYTYSLKDGINDGFLTPFKVKRIKTTMDDYVFTPDDNVIEGEVEQGRVYIEPDFNTIIQIKERERRRVQIFLSDVNQREKAIVFCATQEHAALIRELINQNKESTDPLYCVRVTANDGELGEQYLREFQDNDKVIPTILTTSQKLSTGVDARNIRNIVLLRPIKSMIEFKQIIGRGTRLFDGKKYFTIYDFVDAHHHFYDPEWDGVAEEIITESEEEIIDKPIVGEQGESYRPAGDGRQRPEVIRITLSDGKERQIQHMITTTYFSPDGNPISAEEFLQNLFGILPNFFSSEEQLREIWSDPSTRKALLDGLQESGFGPDELKILQQLINAEDSDVYDVLEYVSFAVRPITRLKRVANSQPFIFDGLDINHKDFVNFVLAKYIESGVGELSQEKLPDLLDLKYKSIPDASEVLGDIERIRNTFIEFQKHLYNRSA